MNHGGVAELPVQVGGVLNRFFYGKSGWIPKLTHTLFSRCWKSLSCDPTFGIKAELTEMVFMELKWKTTLRRAGVLAGAPKGGRWETLVQVSPQLKTGPSSKWWFPPYKGRLGGTPVSVRWSHEKGVQRRSGGLETSGSPLLTMKTTPVCFRRRKCQFAVFRCNAENVGGKIGLPGGVWSSQPISCSWDFFPTSCVLRRFIAAVLCGSGKFSWFKLRSSGGKPDLPLWSLHL